MKNRVRRKRTLIKPALQLRIVGTFVGVATMSFVLQWMLLSSRVTEVAASLPSGGEHLVPAFSSIFLEVLLISLGVYVPICIWVGVLSTFRIAGPLHAIERYLREVAAGKQAGTCRLRKGDELQELCEVVNTVTEPLRAQIASGEGDPGENARAA